MTAKDDGATGGIATLSTGSTEWLRFGARYASAARGDYVEIIGSAMGATSSGGELVLGYNSSGSGAAGVLQFQQEDATANYVWADTTGLIRVHTAAPTADGGVSDTAGTVVGDQTSLRSAKTIYGAFTDNAHALRTMVDTPLWTWSYANGRYHGEKFMGPCPVAESPRFYASFSGFGNSMRGPACSAGGKRSNHGP